MTDAKEEVSAPRGRRQSVQPEAAVLLLAMLFLGGCGGADIVKRAPVSGYVSIDGAPLKTGAIRFVPIENTKGPAAVATIEDGIYELLPENGPVVGKHRIEIDSMNDVGISIDDEQAYAQSVAQGQRPAQNPIPESFNRKSGLFAEVPEEGKANLDFRLSSSGVLTTSN